MKLRTDPCYGTAAHQVHRAAKQLTQFFLHIRPIEQSRVRVSSEGRQQIHIALCPKIIAQSRAEQFQPGNAVLTAEPA